MNGIEVTHDEAAAFTATAAASVAAIVVAAADLPETLIWSTPKKFTELRISDQHIAISSLTRWLSLLGFVFIFSCFAS